MTITWQALGEYSYPGKLNGGKFEAVRIGTSP